MFHSLKGKVALVTGSTSGIGLGVARRLAAQGVNLVLNGFGKPEEIAALQHDLEKEYSIKTNYQGANLRHVSEVFFHLNKIKQMIENATKELGPIQILVNNAGIQHIDAIQDYPEKTFEDVIAINLLAPIYATKYVIPNMKQLNWGRIINIASVHGLVASVNKSGYVAAKHGLVGFTKATALELASTGVTANAVCPGWVMTKLIEKQIQDRADKFKIPFAEAQHKLLEEKQPSCKAITVDQLGDLVTFLSSDSASEMRGSAITMDGGWTSQ